jgi:cell wall assembly regulator SMI1
MGQALRLPGQPTRLPNNVHRLKVPCGTKSRGESEDFLRRAKAAQPMPSYVNYARLKLHPMWNPLRGDPRFQKIVNSLAPKDQSK